MYRHGDLLIKPIKELPKNLKRRKNNILAYGEATGHHHKLTANELSNKDIQVWFDEQVKVFFETKEKTSLSHQEHKTIEIEKGRYGVVVERARDPFTQSINQVID